MRELIKLNKNYNCDLNSELVSYLDPEFVYIPIKKNYNLLVKNKDLVLKEQIIMENNLNKIISPISGLAKEIKMRNISGALVPCLVIENDFKEKAKVVRKKTMVENREALISKLYEYYFKYIASVLETRKINNLVINGIEDEPYIFNNPFILNNYCKEILEISDMIADFFSIPKTIVAVKASDTLNINKCLSSIGTYPNIELSLVDDKYLLGNGYFLREYLNLEELDTLVLSARELIDIYNAIKHDHHITETFITISGNAVEKSQVIKVKIGTLFKDIIDEKVKITSPNVKYIINGLMTGEECDINDSIVATSTKGLVIINNENIKEEECNNCGLCYKICPVKVNPKKVMDTGKISTNCLDCGLCTYMCPNHINLRKYLRGENEK